MDNPRYEYRACWSDNDGAWVGRCDGFLRHQRPDSSTHRWAEPSSRINWNRAWRRRAEGRHQRSSSGHGPAQATTDRLWPVESVSCRGAALTSPRPLTVTGSPPQSVTVIDSGLSSTTAG